ncbi:MAG: hypothetical protein KBE04_15155 [Phycisphaerae bacterium]|nr:hypothetical protein [Phycisphaerae bacterium]
MGDWDIHRPQGQCCATGQKIEVGQEYYAALVETDQGLERRDFSAEYWEHERPSVYCFWKTRLPEASAKRPLFVDDQMLTVFFDRLAQETEPERVAFRFVLALVLMRRRRLKYEATVTEGGAESWRLRWVGQKDTVDVVNPHLDEERITQLSQQIGQVLNADL